MPLAHRAFYPQSLSTCFDTKFLCITTSEAFGGGSCCRFFACLFASLSPVSLGKISLFRFHVAASQNVVLFFCQFLSVVSVLEKDCRLNLRSSRRACRQTHLESLINGLVLFLESLANTPIRQFKVLRSDILVHFSNKLLNRET